MCLKEKVANMRLIISVKRGIDLVIKINMVNEVVNVKGVIDECFLRLASLYQLP